MRNYVRPRTGPDKFAVELGFAPLTTGSFPVLMRTIVHGKLGRPSQGTRGDREGAKDAGGGTSKKIRIEPIKTVRFG